MAVVNLLTLIHNMKMEESKILYWGMVCKYVIKVLISISPEGKNIMDSEGIDTSPGTSHTTKFLKYLH